MLKTKLLQVLGVRRGLGKHAGHSDWGCLLEELLKAGYVFLEIVLSTQICSIYNTLRCTFLLKYFLKLIKMELTNYFGAKKCGTLVP